MHVHGALMERPLALHPSSLRLWTSDGVFAGVTLEPYVLVKKDNLPVALEDVGEEGSAPEGSSAWQLRSRWYRSTIPRAGVVCSVHPEREAGAQCVICVRLRVAQHLSYHCSVDCLKSHWNLHREYHTEKQNGAAKGVWLMQPLPVMCKLAWAARRLIYLPCMQDLWTPSRVHSQTRPTATRSTRGWRCVWSVNASSGTNNGCMHAHVCGENHVSWLGGMTVALRAWPPPHQPKSSHDWWHAVVHGGSLGALHHGCFHQSLSCLIASIA